MSGLELQYGYSASLANVLRMYCAYIVMDGWVDGSMVVNEVWLVFQGRHSWFLRSSSKATSSAFNLSAKEWTRALSPSHRRYVS